MNNLPELLSPAGTPACALAAFDAGADAVYAGLSKFNARERGENFTAQTLTAVVDYAHSLDKKVYLTLNTLLKEEELPELLTMLETVAKINPDGVLVQDLGVLHVIKNYFPQLVLHGSTQMGFHNSAGLKIAEKLGLQRVVLERQITMEELAAIRKKTPLELEVFIHGALCCSLSGSCLFSSYLGGWSGNRGKCKQPCRRRYYTRDGNGFFFSPQDLCAIELIPQLKKIGVQSLKIEGRLRQADYVTNTVQAYRMVLDSPENELDERLSEARNLLSRTCGRRWSHGFYTPQSAKELIKSDAIGAAGMRVGNIKEVREKGFYFVTSKRLFIGDRLRVQPLTGDDGTALTLTKMFIDDQSVHRASANQLVFVCCDKPVPPKAVVYKIGEAFSDYSKRLAALPARRTQVNFAVTLDASGISVAATNCVMDKMHFPLTLQPAEKRPVTPLDLQETFARSDSKIFSAGSDCTFEVHGNWFIPKGELNQVRREFWNAVTAKIVPEAVIPAHNHAAALEKFRNDYLLMVKAPVPQDEYLRETVAMKPNGAEPADRRAIRANNIFEINKFTQEAILPEFCPENRLSAVAKAIAGACAQGIRRFRVTSLYALELLADYSDIFIIASAPLPVSNSLAAKELKNFAVQRITAHIELSAKDISDLAAKSPLEVEAFRLGRPALLVSRAAIPVEGAFNDARGNKFELRREKASGLSRIFPVEVISIPRIHGVYDFYDLRNAHWKNSETGTFNFDTGWM